MLAFDVAWWSLAGKTLKARCAWIVGSQGSRKNSNSHIDASHSRQPLVKGERLVRYEVNAVMTLLGTTRGLSAREDASNRFLAASSSSFAHSPRSTGRSRRQRDLPEKNGAHVALSEKQRNQSRIDFTAQSLYLKLNE